MDADDKVQEVKVEEVYDGQMQLEVNLHSGSITLSES